MLWSEDYIVLFLGWLAGFLCVCVCVCKCVSERERDIYIYIHVGNLVWFLWVGNLWLLLLPIAIAFYININTHI